MDKQTAALVRAFADLNSQQQTDAITQLNNYSRGTRETKTLILSHAIRVDMGPLSGVCPRCGR